MKRVNRWVLGLVVALVVTNGFWLVVWLSNGIALTFSRQQLESHAEQIEQLHAIMPVVSRCDATQAAVVAAAHEASWEPRLGPVEQDPYLWVGELALQFDDEGRLVGIGGTTWGDGDASGP